jgi:Rieske Fe-S protein
MSDTTRRAVIAGAAGVAAASILAACGDDSTDGSGSTGGGGAATTGGAQATTPGSQTTTGGASSALASTSDIPVGGGKIFTDKDVVITQPTAGSFKAFSATCTHQGCPLTDVTNGIINCNCHKSQFSAADGSVKQGPASKALTAKQIKVNGTSITLA